jgi:hypothetical protein
MLAAMRQTAKLIYRNVRSAAVGNCGCPESYRFAGTSEQTKQIREGTMATKIIMDHHGDTRHNFDAKALVKAERRFKTLTGAGFTAATRTASGEPVVTRTFDPTAEETLFFPRLVGGKNSVRVSGAVSRCDQSAPTAPSGLLPLGASLSRLVPAPQ